MFITKKHISRRAVLRGAGVTLALPMMEAMLPAMTPLRRTEAANPGIRLTCIEIPLGAAGCTKFGAERNMWTPAKEGRDFDLTPTSMKSLEPYRECLTIVSNTDCRMAEAFSASEVGADHSRSSAVYLTGAHPKQTLGSDIYCGISMDQVYAQMQDTPVPSLQLAIDDDQSGCRYNYSCVYQESISWSSSTRPLPMVRDPRAVFDQLFGVGGTAAERTARRRTDRSILDWLTREIARLRSDLEPTDRVRLDEYLEDIREVERRIQKIEEYNSSGEPRELPMAPIGVPDSDFEEHVQIMFDLQVLAFASGLTRVSSFKLSRDIIKRVYFGSGVKTGFHDASHHGEEEDKIIDFGKINTYHVSRIPYFLEKLKKTSDGDGNLLDQTVVIYGSPMANPNGHNHRRCPRFLAGHAGGQRKGNRQVKAPEGTPMTNVFLTLLHRMGVDNITSLGDSTGEISI
jgi:hypothetical protein